MAKYEKINMRPFTTAFDAEDYVLRVLAGKPAFVPPVPRRFGRISRALLIQEAYKSIIRRMAEDRTFENETRPHT